MTEQIVVVGASLAGLSAAEAMRATGYTGRLTMIGDEPYLPYDRPPLSKMVATGSVPASGTRLPRHFTRGDDVDWRLGVAASGLDLDRREVRLADGDSVSFDRVLLATGTRARAWFDPEQANLDGVLTLRGRDDAEQLSARLAARPRRVLVIGSGFTGSEMASSCRDIGIPVTVAERGDAPLQGALGSYVARRAIELHRSHGVDLRLGVSVDALEGDEQGRFCGASLSDGTHVDADLAVVALGSIRNTEWLAGSGLAAGPIGVACDAGCRVFSEDLIVTDDVFVAGDISRFPHPIYSNEFMALEHWSNAVEQGYVAGHNMVCEPRERRPHIPIPTFWSSQFGVNIRQVGVATAADQVVITQGSIESGRFIAAYGKNGRTLAAVSFDCGRWLDTYKLAIEQAAPFPPRVDLVDPAAPNEPQPAGFRGRAQVGGEATAILTGYNTVDRQVQWFFGKRPSAPAARPSTDKQE